MKQVLQSLKSGATELSELPVPQCRAGHLLVETRCSLISAGTERMLVEFGKSGWIDKARQQPDKVKQVLNKIRTDGVMPTIEAVRSKLDQPLALGYCNVGTVLEAQSFNAGDRVVSNGPHAEIVCVPKNLCARIPEEVSDEEAAFTVVGAIGLQGIRLAQPTLGECFVVTGLGLIGLLTVQLLKANGCRVLGIDFDSQKMELAKRFGAETVDLSNGEDPVKSALAFSRGIGVDGVVIAASTKSNDPVHQAALMCRKRGRIVLVGVTGLELSRDDFYKKELSFQVSCSYGPGRYDPEYEDKGHDYPIGYVRWTEQRNFEAVLDLMVSGKLNVKPLISHRFPIEEAQKAYSLFEGKEPYLGIILEYQKTEVLNQEADLLKRIIRLSGKNSEKETSLTPHTSRLTPVIGFIGAGNYAGRVLLPSIQKRKVRLKIIASSGGVTGTHLGKKFGFEFSTTDLDSLFEDPEINTIFIATRHNSHAALVCRALQARKHVFVEKPLCLTKAELKEIVLATDLHRPTLTFPPRTLAEEKLSSLARVDTKSIGENFDAPKSTNSPLITPHASLILMVGFNRRFSPQVLKIKSLMDAVKEPKSMIMTVNAGMIPGDHWTQDLEVGGGRIIGEACHFVDLLRFLAGGEIISSDIVKLKGGAGDTVTINFTFADGSHGSIHYLANGHKSFPKERLEVFCAGRVLQLDNFRRLKGYGWPGFTSMNLWRQDKGQDAEIRSFFDAICEGRSSPIPFEDIVEVMRVTFELSEKRVEK